jgi:hypothetical protein
VYVREGLCVNICVCGSAVEGGEHCTTQHKHTSVCVCVGITRVMVESVRSVKIATHIKECLRKVITLAWRIALNVCECIWVSVCVCVCERETACWRKYVSMHHDALPYTTLHHTWASPVQLY